MATFVYNDFKHDLGTAGVDFSTDDFRAMFVMTNTTVGPIDTDNSGTAAQDVLTIAGFDTLDEYNGANHPAGGIALSNEAYAKDAANNRSEFDADDILFASLGAGTRQAQAVLLYKFITDLNSSQPVAYYDTGGFPFAGSGSNVTIQWNTEGVLQIG